MRIVDRAAFADFLDRLAEGRTDALEWNRYIVAHYADPFLEEMRRCTVRLMLNQLRYHGDTEPGREALRCWAMALLASENRASSVSSDGGDVVVRITEHEAVVLDEFLRRFSTTDVLAIEHPAERRMLWNLQCVMEKHGDCPLWPSLEASRAALSDDD